MAPETVRTLARRMGAVAALALLAVAAAFTPAHAIKVTTWNLLKYPDLNLAGRQPHFRTVMQNLDTDIIMVQELKSSAGADSFLLNVLRVANPTRHWANAGFLIDTESAIFYDSLRIAISNVTSINTTGPRNVARAWVQRPSLQPMGRCWASSPMATCAASSSKAPTCAPCGRAMPCTARPSWSARTPLPSTRPRSWSNTASPACWSWTLPACWWARSIPTT